MRVYQLIRPSRNRSFVSLKFSAMRVMVSVVDLFPASITFWTSFLTPACVSCCSSWFFFSPFTGYLGCTLLVTYWPTWQPDLSKDAKSGSLWGTGLLLRLLFPSLNRLANVLLTQSETVLTPHLPAQTKTVDVCLFLWHCLKIRTWHLRGSWCVITSISKRGRAVFFSFFHSWWTYCSSTRFLVDTSSLPGTDRTFANRIFIYRELFSVFIRSSLTTCWFTSQLANPLLRLIDREDETIVGMRMTDDKRQLLEARVYKKIPAKSTHPTPPPPPNGHIVFENVSNIIISCALGTGKLRGKDLKDSNSRLAACMQNNCWQPPDLDTRGIFAGRAKVARVCLPCDYQPKVQKSWACFLEVISRKCL